MATKTKSANSSGPETTNTARQAEVILGGELYMIHALNMKAARQWRREFSKPIQAALSMMDQVQGVEISDVGNAASVLQQVATFLLGSVDVLVDALFAYSPELQADRERIEETADDTEAMEALWEVLKLAYPFGNLVTLFNRGAATTGK